MNLCLKNEIRRCRPLLGTFVEVTVDHHDAGQAQRAIDAAFAAIERVGHLMSFHDPQSEVSRLNRLAAHQNVFISCETYEVLRCAKELHERTEGIFDITVASELLDRGLLPNHAFLSGYKNYCGRTSDIELLPDGLVHFLRPLCIDLGGIAKGFAVDQAVEALEHNGIQNGLVNAGGDMHCFGVQEHPVLIRPPAVSAEFIFWPTLLKNAAMATSSVRTDSVFSKNLASAGHVKMPSGDFLKEVKTATVFAQKCLLADALTKVVLLGSADASARVLAFYRTKALVFGSNGQLETMMGDLR